MRTPWADTPFFEPPKRKVYCRPATRYKVGALAYPEREEYGSAEWVPYIKLRGRWLGKVGFEVGADLKVEASYDRIVLTVVKRPVVEPPKIPRKLQRGRG